MVLVDKLRVTPKSVTNLFNLRTDLWRASDEESLKEVAGRFGLPPGTPKQILGAFFENNFPASQDRGEHFQKMRVCEGQIRQLFQDRAKETGLIVFGSYSLGVINGPHSDLDYMAILGKRLEDLAVFEQLEQAGIIVSSELSGIQEMGQIVETGRGLARVYAVSEDGVEVEFHVLGQQDALDIHKLSPGFIKRVRAVPPKMEVRMSFRGQRREVPKNSDIVEHYMFRNGEYLRGFFPDAMIMGTILHDPNGITEEVMRNVWYSSVKGYLYHNGIIQKQDDGSYGIDLKRVNLDDFMETTMPQNKTFSPERYETCQQLFYATLKKLTDRFKFTPL